MKEPTQISGLAVEQVCSKKIRIFSSAENCRRVLRLISLTCLSADPFGSVFVLISHPFKDYDELKTRAKQKLPFCLKGCDGIQNRTILEHVGPDWIRDSHGLRSVIPCC